MPLVQAAGQFAELMAGCRFNAADGAALDGEGVVADVLSEFARVKQQQAKVIILGNGGSAAIASHVITDLRNVGGLCALTLHEAAPLTCFTNDFGYEQAFAKQVSAFAYPDDVLIAISSSGQSANIVNAVAAANAKGLAVLTLSGFKPDNPLRRLGRWNVWLDSNHYGMVELAHLFVLHHITDQLIKK
ncbi:MULTISPECIES: SIS domain-containing protein [Methylomonas]|uniref:Phosphoheptose isomerase n=1 Tax=Methylomonas koyamae TaxID=702114 RepID=A0A177NBL1_9GAMM|nr:MULTISPECIES: SIS domain-containing protein [Methylomonas]NJA07678.1 SIS domain-containing protein [Methylococcaceae bacterium WWC4]OAI15221.1 phosphoheptose isomerase [Methylomonas koyamae]OHX34638.1 phosphoheptose isomerase [Methylomonas sp. LWB]